MTLVVAAGLALKSLQSSSSSHTDSCPSAVTGGIVALPNGATMVAKNGTVGRELIDWLAGDEHSRSFELGGQEFTGRSAEPTMQSQVRLPRLIEMLKAHPDVRIEIIGHSDRSADRAADLALSETRAHNVAHALELGGISARRIAFEGHGGDQPIGDDQLAGGRARKERGSI